MPRVRRPKPLRKVDVKPRWEILFVRTSPHGTYLHGSMGPMSLKAYCGRAVVLDSTVTPTKVTEQQLREHPHLYCKTCFGH